MCALVEEGTDKCLDLFYNMDLCGLYFHICKIPWHNTVLVVIQDAWMEQSTCWSDQVRSVAQSYPTLCDPMNHSTPGLPVYHQLPEFTETHVHWVSDAIQPSHPLSSPSPPASNPSQHQSLFQWVNSSHEVAKVLEFHMLVLWCNTLKFHTCYKKSR